MIANFCKNQAVLGNFDSLKFWFPSFFDIWLQLLSKAKSQNFGVWKTTMADLQLFDHFLTILTFMYFWTTRGYISCREKGHMDLFHNSRSPIGVASKIKKNLYDHNGGLSNGGLSNGSLKAEQNIIFIFWALYYSTRCYFHVNIFGKSVILLQQIQFWFWYIFLQESGP